MSFQKYLFFKVYLFIKCNMDKTTPIKKLTVKQKKLQASYEKYGSKSHRYKGFGDMPYDPDFQTMVSGIQGYSNSLDAMSLDQLREEARRQYSTAPFILTSTHDSRDALCGEIFRVFSEYPVIQNIINKTFNDFRNRFYRRIRQYVLEQRITTELFILFSISYDEQFISVDMIPPENIGGIGDDGCGILFHSQSSRLPLIYNVKNPATGQYEHIPSVFVAYQPDILKDITSSTNGFDEDKLKNSRAMLIRQNMEGEDEIYPDSRFASVGGFRRFITEWEGPRLTSRSASNLRAALIWNNLYIMLKMIEINHKRAMSQFTYAAQFSNEDSFDAYLSLTEEQMAKTGLTAPKEPGSTVLVSPGCDMKILSANLPKLSGDDQDTLDMISSALNTTRSQLLGTSEDTYAGVKLAKGNVSDRIKADQNDFRMFLIDDIFRPILFFHTALWNFRSKFKKYECVGFTSNTSEEFLSYYRVGDEQIDLKKSEQDNSVHEIWTYVERDPWELISIVLPNFSYGLEDSEVKFLQGTKTGSASDTLGISKSSVAERLGINNYHEERLKLTTEKMRYPKTVMEQLPLGTSMEQRQEQLLEPPQPQSLTQRNF